MHIFRCFRFQTLTFIGPADSNHYNYNHVVCSESGNCQWFVSHNLWVQLQWLQSAGPMKHGVTDTRTSSNGAKRGKHKHTRKHLHPLRREAPSPNPYEHYGFQRVWLKHNLNSKGWNSRAQRGFPGKFESSNLSTVGIMLVGKPGVRQARRRRGRTSGAPLQGSD